MVEARREDPERVGRALAAAIRRRRLRLGLSFTGLGQRSGLSRQTLRDVEKGRHGMNAYNLVKVANGLGTTAALLFAEASRTVREQG